MISDEARQVMDKVLCSWIRPLAAMPADDRPPMPDPMFASWRAGGSGEHVHAVAITRSHVYPEADHFRLNLCAMWLNQFRPGEVMYFEPVQVVAVEGGEPYMADALRCRYTRQGFMYVRLCDVEISDLDAEPRWFEDRDPGFPNVALLDIVNGAHLVAPNLQVMSALLLATDEYDQQFR